MYYSTEYGMYEPNCGLDNVLISWGHDEYLYRVLKNHGTTIPEEGLAMIRYIDVIYFRSRETRTYYRV